MTKRKIKAAVGEIKRLLDQDDTFIREGVCGYARVSPGRSGDGDKAGAGSGE